MGLSGVAIGTYRPQYRPLSAIRYLDANPLPTRYTLFITMLETDASMVKTALEGDEYRLSSMGGIVTEIKHLMAMEFSSCVSSICSRNCNKLAHGL
jgi:hypothetical protein